MENIHISLDDVTETASRIRQLSDAMYEDLTAMKKDMNLLSGTWISEGSEEIRNRFNMLSARFEDQKDVIESVLVLMLFFASLRSGGSEEGWSGAVSLVLSVIIISLTAGAVRFLGDLEIQQLAVAGLAHRQRQHDGHDGMGMIALGVADLQLRAGKGPLEGAHEVQMGDVGSLGLLDEQQTQLRHGTSPLPDGWRRSRCIGCGSPAW